MTLLERERICREQGCRRAPVYPDLAYCEQHRVRWMPEWRRRLVAKDLTRSAA